MWEGCELTLKEEKLKEIISDAIIEKLKNQFNLGLICGFDVSIETIYKEVKGMTSAKAIKALLKSRMEEVNARKDQRKA